MSSPQTERTFTHSGRPARSSATRFHGWMPTWMRSSVLAGAMLAASLTQAGTLIHAAGPDPAASPPGESPAAAALLARERAIADRLTGVANDPAALGLSGGLRDPADRKLATRVLERLRGDDGAIVRNACVVRVGGKGRSPIDGGLGDPKTSACVDRALRDAAAGALPASVVRALITSAGADRLVLAAPMPDGGGVGAVISIDVDLTALLDAAVPGPSVRGQEGTLAMVVDLATATVVASATAAGMPDATGSTDMVASIRPLWSMAEGRRLGLMELTPAVIGALPPAPVPTTSGPSDIGLLVGIVLLVTVLGMVAHALRSSARLQQSRARVEALYREAGIGPVVDDVTGLPARAAFEVAMDERMTMYLENGLEFAVAVIDVDDLRSVNDRDGRLAGDETLRVVAETMQRLTRPEDGIFRLGEDEFAVLFPGRDVPSVTADLERVLHFSRRPEPGTRPVSFSAGVSGVPSSSTDGDIVLGQASAALAWVKGHGRGAVEAYDAERDHVPDQPHDIANFAVREVVAGRLLSPVFQPIVDLRTGRVLGFEGLIRPDPSGPLPSTSHLFAAASASGRTVELDLACVEVVLAGAQAIGPDRLLTLNLSPKTLEVRDFDAAWLLDVLLRNGIAPGRVIVELTERDAVGDLRRLQQALHHLQSYGLRLAADDVGAGNAGLRLLSQVQFDIVKIDLTLVQEGVHQPGSRAVLESLRDLAISQNAHIVAEGVETAEQLRVIRDLEIGAAQGYLLGRPAASVETTYVDLAQLASGIVLPTAAGVVGPGTPEILSGGAIAMAARPLRWGVAGGATAR